MKTIILGTGNVATHLAKALQANGHEIVQIYSRSQESAQAFAGKLHTPYCTLPEQLMEAELYIYALADDALQPVIERINRTSGIHVHTAGSVEMNIFAAKVKQYGVLYPLQTFSKDKEIDFSEVPIFVEGSNAVVTKTLVNFAQSLTTKTFEANSEQRISLHIAAVFACNFSNYLYTIAAEILQKQAIPFELLHPLILETALKIQTLSPVAAQTGPARRKDRTTMEKQLAMLSNEDVKRLYTEISSQISNSY